MEVLNPGGALPQRRKRGIFRARSALPVSMLRKMCALRRNRFLALSSATTTPSEKSNQAPRAVPEIIPGTASFHACDRPGADQGIASGQANDQ